MLILQLKTKVLCMTLAALSSLGLVITPKDDAHAISENMTQYLDEFMELSPDKLEDMYGDTSVNYDNSVQVFFSAYQWNQLIDEFVLQNDVPADDPMATQAAFYDLILEKLHLSGVYNAFADYEISSWEFAESNRMNTSSDPSEWKVDDQDSECVVVDCCLDPRNIVTDADGMYRLVYEGNTVAMTAYEVVKRTVYVINTYGDKDYYVYAYQTPLDKDVPDQTTTTETTTTTTTTTTAPTTTAGGVATGDASVMYLLFAGIGAAAVASFAKRRKDTSA